eukprot:TRINITY_DN12546_c0_g1_i1.p1 TRINITY_DN12546_c0_g1~~TRINITY_DN12546_c0_g1_i1.p1  ORF type:complete len:510 (+),score=80.96 TRINITY_DN12546_c0_g1_i1:614-2143(+)
MAGLAWPWVLALTLLPVAASAGQHTPGTSLSLWLDTGFARSPFVVFENGANSLTLTRTATHHQWTYVDGPLQWVCPETRNIQDLVLGFVIVNASKDNVQTLHLYENYVSLTCLKSRTPWNGDPSRGALGDACHHLHHNSFKHKRRTWAIGVCEVKHEALRDRGVEEWARYQRDNTIGLEPRNFVVNGNGPSSLVHDTTLGYNFTAGVLFRLRKTPKGNALPLMWQGSGVLLTYTAAPEEAEGHGSARLRYSFSLYLSDPVEIWASDQFTGNKGDRVHIAITREIAEPERVAMFHAGTKVGSRRVSSDAFELFLPAFETVEDATFDIVEGLTAVPLLLEDIEVSRQAHALLRRAEATDKIREARNGTRSSECTHNCCLAHATPGCTDEAIRGCVCMVDSYCCTTQWDRLCTRGVSLYGCGDCACPRGEVIRDRASFDLPKNSSSPDVNAVLFIQDVDSLMRPLSPFSSSKNSYPPWLVLFWGIFAVSGALGLVSWARRATQTGEKDIKNV